MVADKKEAGLNPKASLETSSNLPKIISKNDSSKKANLVLVPESIFLVDFDVTSPEFELLKRRFKHPKAAVVLQHLEFLNRAYEVPDGGIYRNIYPSKNKPCCNTIVDHIGIKSRRIVYDILQEIRVSYTFKKGLLLTPGDIDFQGKLYASFYLPSHGNRTIYWYRNVKLINQLHLEILEEVASKHQSNKFRIIIPKNKGNDPPSDMKSETASEPVGEPSFTFKEVEVKSKNDKTVNSNNSLKLVTSDLPEDQSKAPGKAKPSQIINNDFTTGFTGKDNTDLELGRRTYAIYKHYCKTAEKTFLLKKDGSLKANKDLGKFARTFIELGFGEKDLSSFFERLTQGHFRACEYLKDHSVWQVKDCKSFMSIELLAKFPELFASWYNAETADETKFIITKSMQKIDPIPEKIKPQNPSSPGFTYVTSNPTSETVNSEDSVEYFYVLFANFGDEFDKEVMMMTAKDELKRYAIDPGASLARIKVLKKLSKEEFLKLPFPR